MAVLKMRKIFICALKKERKPILEKIQQSGVVEIKETKGGKKGFAKMDTAVAKASFERNTAQAENALDILSQYAPDKKSIFSSLEGKRVITVDDLENISNRREQVMSKIAEIISLQKKITSMQSEVIKLHGQIEAITPWLPMDVSGAITKTARTSFFYGSIPGNVTQEELYKRIEEQGSFPKASEVQVFYNDKNQTCVAGFCMNSDRDAFETALRELEFSRPALMMQSVPKELRESWLNKIEELEEQISWEKAELIKLSDYRNDIQLTADYFRSRAEKYDVLGRIWQTKNVFFITGYIPEKSEDRLKNELTSNYTVFVETEEIPDKEEAPVALENKGFAKPVEGIVESFGLPKKGEIDPSAIMAFFYYFLFGMMLSDAAYGLIITVACFAALKKFPRMSESMNKSLHMFMYCGISTAIWGVLFGGYFGDVITVVADVFFNKTVTVPALWFVPLNEPMRLLVYALVIGIIHMFLGMGIKGYMLLRDKKIVDFISDVVFWYAFLAGLILMLIPTELFSSIAQISIQFPQWLNMLAKILALGGAAGILIMSGRRKGNKWPLRLALGAYDIYGVTSWLSDWLSYSRLLALGLATGVIASVVNAMGSMAGTGVVGTIVFILVFIVGHTLNLAINLLGAYVHTNRLQYVEFFGKFYEGGGRAFNPFKLKTNYVEVEEENK